MPFLDGDVWRQRQCLWPCGPTVYNLSLCQMVEEGRKIINYLMGIGSISLRSIT